MQPPLGPAPGPAQQAVAAFDWPVIAPVPGLHSLQPDAGQQRWTKSTAGALNCKRSCGECSKTATNSSRLFELLRTSCGEQPGEWRQLMHAAAAQGDKVACTRCGTTRQAHIQLRLQKCPVRGLLRGGAEDPAGTEMYAAWHRTVRAMHAFARESGAAQPAAPLAAEAAVAAMADEHLVAEPAVPRLFVLRPFRSRVMAKCAAVEFCMQCCVQTPRHSANRWKAGCCDGRTPIGACPRYILAAVSLCPATWPRGHENRGQELVVAARALRSNLAAKALRPPKRRMPRGPQQRAGHLQTLLHTVF